MKIVQVAGKIKTWIFRQRQRLEANVTQHDLEVAFSRLGMPRGAIIGIHAKLSSLGYISGGPVSIFRALQNVVPDCTIIMATFPFFSSTVDYLANDPVCDPHQSPSKSGLLSETLRKYPGVRRSLHPTHPCTAVGPEADRLIEGSERSETPFGPKSSYGRYVRSEKAYQLLLGTNSTSIVHVFQEAVGWPNLFLEEQYTARGLDYEGVEHTYRVKVHVPRVQLYVAVPDTEGGFQYIWMPSYCLLFPQTKLASVCERITNDAVASALVERDRGFERSGVFRKALCGTAEILAIEVGPWLDAMVRELKANVEQYCEAYEYDRVAQQIRSGAVIP